MSLKGAAVKHLPTVVPIVCAFFITTGFVQAPGDLTKTTINLSRSRYARGDLVTGSTVTKNLGLTVSVPGKVVFKWYSDVQGLTSIGTLYTNNGQTNLADLAFYVPTSPSQDNVHIVATWSPTVPSYLGASSDDKRIPIGLP